MSRTGPTAPKATGPRTVERSFEPKAPIKDKGKLVFTFTVDDTFRAGDVHLDLNIDHANRTDLNVFLTTPSGKKAVLNSREGLARPDMKGTFNLTSALDREPVKGEWKLTVLDMAKGDQGTLNSWKMRLTEGEQRPSPPEASDADDLTSNSGFVRIDASKTKDGQFQLVDPSRGQGIETRDTGHSFNDATVKPITDADNIWGTDPKDKLQASAVDVQYGAQMTYDFLRDVLGRDSIDGKGEKLVNSVHVGPLPRPAAVWLGDQAAFADDEDGNAMTSVDVVGSTIAQGLVNRTGKFDAWGEPMAVAEGLAQVIGGAGVEWYATTKNPSLAGGLNPYVIGEQEAGTAKAPLANFADPSSDDFSVDHYALYNPDRPLRGAGIVTNAFYLLTHGGTNKHSKAQVEDPISLERGIKIFGRALLSDLPSNPTFAQTREATIAAAGGLYGKDSKEVQKVMEAWDAVGIHDFTAAAAKASAELQAKEKILAALAKAAAKKAAL